MAAAFLLGPRRFLQLPRRVHSPEAGSEGSGGAGSAHQALCSCPRGQLCRARSRAGRRWASHSPSSWRNMGVFLEPCAPPVSFCFWTMWGVRRGGLAAVFWRQNHRYAGHTSGRVSGNLPWGRQKLERKATDSGYLLILPGLPGAQRWPRPAQVRRGSRALCVKVHVVWDFDPQPRSCKYSGPSPAAGSAEDRRARSPPGSPPSVCPG